MECKPNLRRTLLAQRDAVPQTEREARRARAEAHLLARPELIRARTVLLFLSFGSEIETRPLLAWALAAGKQVGAPRTERAERRIVPYEIRDPATDLTPGAYGIDEPRASQPPLSLDAIEAVIVPAVAWGEDGFRVGYGAGYYDRFLSLIPQAVRIGFGFELQVVPKVPHTPQDLPVDLLVTEVGVRRFARR